MEHSTRQAVWTVCVENICGNSSHPLPLWGPAWLLSWVSEVRGGRGGREDTWEEEKERNYYLHSDSDSISLYGRIKKDFHFKKKKDKGNGVIVFVWAFTTDVKAPGDLCAVIIAVNHLLLGSFPPILQCNYLICECVGLYAYDCLHYRAILVR